MPSRAYIGAFGFKGPDQQKPTGVLSGGERNRLNLALTLKEGGNVLLLDEPTNDLDVETLGSLENALLEFPGCAVVISHDRWFLDRGRHAHPGVGGRRREPREVVLVRGQLRVLREEQGRAPGPGCGAPAPRDLPQAHPGGLRGIDKVVHVLLFCALAASTRWRWRRGLWVVSAYAVVSEVLQATLPIHRDGDPFDALADSAGAVLGWLLAVRLPQDEADSVVPDHTG